MERKAMLMMLLTLLLVFSGLVSNIRVVGAGGTIYIRADGSIDPPTAPIASVDNVTYTFTGNIYDSTIVVERSNIVIDGAGYTVRGTEPYSLPKGIDLSHRSNVTVKNTTIRDCWYCIHLYYTSKVTLIGNNIGWNSWYGIWLNESSYIAVSGNDLRYNTYGVWLDSSSNNSISENNITNNGDGVHLYDSSFNTVSGNNITNNDYGVYLFLWSDSNFIHRNNFINNTRQVYDRFWDPPFNRLGLSSINVWDDSYPSGGNYWSDYTGVDADGDGIGDTPYIIDANNKDRYPLMNPTTPTPPTTEHDIETITIRMVPGKTVLGQGYSLRIDVLIMNYGAYTETFNVTLYANTTSVTTITNIILTSRCPIVITFTWNTTGWAKGNYTISAVADTVPGEVDTADNTYIDGIVTVVTPGDVNADGIVDIADAGGISAHWYPGPPIGPLGYDPNFDINCDGAVDIADVGIVSAYWTGPPKGPLAP